MKQVLFLVFSLAACLSTSAQWIQIGQDLNGDSQQDILGTAVSISADGNIVATSAPQSDIGSQNSGLVRVFQLQGSTWTQLGQDIVGVTGDQLGYSLSLNSIGNRIVVGAEFADGAGVNSGKAMVYELQNDNWVQIGQTIEGLFADDRLGKSVKMNSQGNKIIVGTPNFVDQGLLAGRAQIFELQGSSWIQVGDDLIGDISGGSFGYAVDMNSSGNIVIVGARGEINLNAQGYLRVYEYNGSNWMLKGQELTGVEMGDRFGYSVVVNDGGTLLAHGSPAANQFFGRARIYGLENNVWTQIGSDITGSEDNIFFGVDIDFNESNNLLAVSSWGDSSSNGRINFYNINNNDWIDLDEPIIGGFGLGFFGESMELSSSGKKIVSGTSGSMSSTGRTEMFENDNILGVNNLSLTDESTILFPNPSDESFVLKFPKAQEKLQVYIYDSNGRRVYQKKYNDLDCVEITHSLPSGIYFVQTINKGMTATKKLLVF